MGIYAGCWRGWRRWSSLSNEIKKEEDEIVELLSQQPDFNATEARALVHQVKGHDYNPPKRERILEWQAEQDFAICPTPDEPGACNVYQELRFPEHVYENISDFWEEQVKAEDNSSKASQSE